MMGEAALTESGWGTVSPGNRLSGNTEGDALEDIVSPECGPGELFQCWLGGNRDNAQLNASLAPQRASTMK